MAVRRTTAGWVFVLATMSVAPGCGDAVTSPSTQMDEALRLSVTSATLEPGESLRIEATAAGTVSWESSDPQVVAVSATGVVVARREGEAEIIARAKGKRGKAKVRVDGTPEDPATGDPTPAPADPESPPTDPAPTPADPSPTPTQPTAASMLLYGHDFDDGTIGSFGQWGGHTPKPVSVIADPTGAGRGKVARVDYMYDPASGGSHDSNAGLYYRANPAGGHPGGVGFGERIYLAGDFYLPRYPHTAPAQAQFEQRKLIYVKFGNPDSRTGDLAIITWGRADKGGMDLSLVSGRNEGREQAYQLAPVAFDKWHRLELELVANHKDASDGSIRVWLNGRLVKERKNVVLFSPSGNADSDFIYEYGIGNQEQWSPGDVMKNYRFWDNIEFRTARR